MKILRHFICIFLLVATAPLMAHSKLIFSEPANEAELTATPEKMILEFNREVRLVKLAILNGNEKAVEVDFKPVAENNTKFEITLPTLESGDYQVNWMAMSKDSHKMKGQFSFSLTVAEKAAGNTKNKTAGNKVSTMDKKKPCKSEGRHGDAA